MTREEFVKWALGRGWELDKFGHLQKAVDGKEYRFKLSSIAVRQEVRVHYTMGGADWVRLRSGYFSALSVAPDGKVAGLTAGMPRAEGR